MSDQKEIENITIDILIDYIKNSLLQKNYHWINEPNSQCIHYEVCVAMEVSASEMAVKFKHLFNDLLNEFYNTPTDENTGYQKFLAVCTGVFEPEPSWAKVVAVFVFAGQLAVHFAETNQQELIDCIISWMRLYVHNSLANFIINKGGWNNFINQ